jgi:two-component system sensor histidine kinase YesM
MLQETETNLQFLADKINTSTDHIVKFSTTCSSSTVIVNYLMTSKENPRYNHTTSVAVQYLNNEYDNNASKQYIQRTIVGGFAKDDFLQEVSAYHSVDRPMSDLVKQLPYFYSYINYENIANYDYEVKTTPFPGTTKQIIPFIQPISYPYNNSFLGYIYNEISITLFTDAVRAYIDSGINSIYLTIGDNTYLLNSNNERELVPVNGFEISQATKTNTFVFSDTKLSYLHEGHDKHTIVTRPLAINGCSISAQLSPVAFSRLYHKYIAMIIIIITAIFLSGIIAMTLMYRLLMDPIRDINQHIRKISVGQFAPDRNLEWDNEIGDIGRIINKLGENMDELLKKRIEDECEKKDYEYKMLQSQINPHFLYNTLNSIKWMATIQHADGISEMTTALSRLMKNISKGRNSIVSISDEISLLNDYYTIQKYRYGGSITMDYDIADDTILNNKILRFTLQPVVENAIFHGIEPKGNAGNIKIHMFYNNEDHLQIEITDDGIGFKPELIEHVLAEDDTTDSTFFKGMGIASVNKMIKYTFGDNYGMSIASEANVYTTVTILLPKIFIERSPDIHETFNS